MIKRSSVILRIAVIAVLVIGSSLAIEARFQSDLPGKIRVKQSTHQPQDEARPAPDVAGVWQAFAASRAGQMAVTWNRQTGTPESIFGELSAARASISEAAARSFLAENVSLFKMSGGLDDLALERSYESPLGQHYVFQQRYRGIAVYGAQTAVHFNKAGSVIAVNNSYKPDIALDTVEPQVSLYAALDRARVELSRRALRNADVELVIYGSDDSFSLAWHIVAPTNGPTWELFLNATSGEMIGQPRDINRYVNGTGQVFIVNAIVATRDNSLRDNNDAASAVPSSAYTIVTLQGLNGNGFLDGQFASSIKTKKRASSSSNSFIFNRSQVGFSETMGYHYIDYAQRYIQSLGFTNVNNRQQVFSVNRYNPDNSFYSPSTKEITYGLGGVDDAEDADVVLHEYGHSIQDNQVPGFGSSSEGGAMGEGFGDYWAGSIGAQLSGGFQDECIAEWDATSYSSTNPPCLRRLDSAKHYPENVAGEVHRDGEIWSAALWQIRGSIGAARADKVILQAHFLLSSNATFNQGANALVSSAINLGYTTAEVNSIRTILQNRGFTVTV